MSEDDHLITARFADGTEYTGSLLIACDGGHSNARQAVFPATAMPYRIPVGVLGLKVEHTPDRIKELRELDPFFLQGTSSKDGSFMYFSSEFNPLLSPREGSGGF